jgi:TPR repeat protein
LGRLHLAEFGGLEAIAGIDWLVAGAAQGHPGAFHELAKLYAEGQLVSHDMKRAKDYAERGARLKHVGSKSLLEKLNQEISGAESAKSAAKAEDG